MELHALERTGKRTAFVIPSRAPHTRRRKSSKSHINLRTRGNHNTVANLHTSFWVKYGCRKTRALLSVVPLGGCVVRFLLQRVFVNKGRCSVRRLARHVAKWPEASGWELSFRLVPALIWFRKRMLRRLFASLYYVIGTVFLNVKLVVRVNWSYCFESVHQTISITEDEYEAWGLELSSSTRITDRTFQYFSINYTRPSKTKTS